MKKPENNTHVYKDTIAVAIASYSQSAKPKDIASSKAEPVQHKSTKVRPVPELTDLMDLFDDTTVTVSRVPVEQVDAMPQPAQSRGELAKSQRTFQHIFKLMDGAKAEIMTAEETRDVFGDVKSGMVIDSGTLMMGWFN